MALKKSTPKCSHFRNVKSSVECRTSLWCFSTRHHYTIMEIVNWNFMCHDFFSRWGWTYVELRSICVAVIFRWPAMRNALADVITWRCTWKEHIYIYWIFQFVFTLTSENIFQPKKYLLSLLDIYWVKSWPFTLAARNWVLFWIPF